MGMENLEGKETTGTPSTDNSQNSVADSTKNESDAVAKRHSEQLEGSKKEVEFYKNVTAVQKDITKLVTIAEADSKTARRIVKEITEGTQYEGKTLEEIISIIKGDDVKQEETKVSKEEILKEARLEAYKERLEEELPEDSKDEIISKYNRLAKAGVSSKEDIKEYMRLARFAILGDEKKESKKKVDDADIASTPFSRAKGTDSTPKNRVELSNGISEIRKRLGINN